MKTHYFLTLLLLVSLFTACRKDYSCSAIDAAGNESVFNCENCTTKAVDDYKQSILDKGYVSATCNKK